MAGARARREGTGGTVRGEAGAAGGEELIGGAELRGGAWRRAQGIWGGVDGNREFFREKREFYRKKMGILRGEKSGNCEEERKQRAAGILRWGDVMGQKRGVIGGVGVV